MGVIERVQRAVEGFGYEADKFEGNILLNPKGERKGTRYNIKIIREEGKRYADSFATNGPTDNGLVGNAIRIIKGETIDLSMLEQATLDHLNQSGARGYKTDLMGERVCIWNDEGREVGGIDVDGDFTYAENMDYDPVVEDVMEKLGV